jgi:SET domain-containing protein
MTTDFKQTQIDWLNMAVKVYLAPSKIHGVGVFALRDLQKGEQLYADYTPKVFTLTYSDLKKVDQPIRDLILGQWPQIINGSHFAYPTTRIQAYINHADKPSYDAQNDTLFKDVKKGEEITENYRAIPNYAKIFPWL